VRVDDSLGCSAASRREHYRQDVADGDRTGRRVQEGTPYFWVNASASSADSGAVPEVTARMLLRSSRVRPECNTARRAAGTKDTAFGRCRRTASAHWLISKRSRSANDLASQTLKHPEHAADVHERCVDDRHSVTKFPRRRRPIELGPDHAARQHVVGQVDSLRRSRGPAGQHPHSDPRTAGALTRSGGDHAWRVAEARDRDRGCVFRGPHQRRQIVVVADDH
jgi:hypothetical protein